jgi:hypothetical protein
MPFSLIDLLAQQYGVTPSLPQDLYLLDQLGLTGLRTGQTTGGTVMQAPRPGSVNLPPEPRPMTWREAVERTGEQAAAGLLAPQYGLAKAISDATGWRPPLMGAAERIMRNAGARVVDVQPSYAQRSVIGAGRSLGQMLPLLGFGGTTLSGIGVAVPWWSLGEYPREREDFSPVKAAFASIAQGATEMLMPNPLPFLRQTGPLGMIRSFAGETGENVAQEEIDAMFRGERPSLGRMLNTAVEGAGSTGILVGLGGTGFARQARRSEKPGRLINAPIPEDRSVREGRLAKVADKVWNSTLNNGGATHSLLIGDRSKSKGYAVSSYPNREVIVPLDEFTPEVVRSFIAQNKGVLTKDPKANLGTWVNNVTGNVHIDVTKVEPSLDKAIREGVKGDQFAIYDLPNERELWLKELKSPDLDPNDPDNWAFVTQPNTTGDLFAGQGGVLPLASVNERRTLKTSESEFAKLLKSDETRRNLMELAQMKTPAPRVDVEVPPEFADVLQKAQQIVEKQTKKREELGRAGKLVAEKSPEQKLVEAGVIYPETMEPIGTTTPSLVDMANALKNYATVKKGEDSKYGVKYDPDGIPEMIHSLEEAYSQPMNRKVAIGLLQDALSQDDFFPTGGLVGSIAAAMEPHNARFYASLAFQAALGDPTATVMARIMASGPPSVSKMVAQRIVKSLDDVWIPHIQPRLQDDQESLALFREYEYPSLLEDYESRRKEAAGIREREINRVFEKDTPRSQEEREFLESEGFTARAPDTHQLNYPTRNDMFLPYGKRFAAELDRDTRMQRKNVGIFDERGEMIGTVLAGLNEDEASVLRKFEAMEKKKAADAKRIEDAVGKMRASFDESDTENPIVNRNFSRRVGVTKAVNAFFEGKNVKAHNDEVERIGDISYYRLFGNVIAEYDHKTKVLVLDDAGWRTVSTKERLNAILSAIGRPYIHQSEWVWYHDGQRWSGNVVIRLGKQRTPANMANMAASGGRETGSRSPAPRVTQLELPNMPPATRDVVVKKTGDSRIYAQGKTSISGNVVQSYSTAGPVLVLQLDKIIDHGERRSYAARDVLDRAVKDMLDNKVSVIGVPTDWARNERLGDAVRYVMARYGLGVIQQGDRNYLYPENDVKNLRSIGRTTGLVSKYKRSAVDTPLSDEFYTIELPKYRIQKPFWSAQGGYIITELDHKHKRAMMGVMEALEERLGLPKAIRSLYQKVGQGSYLSPSIVAMANPEDMTLSVSVAALDDYLEGKNTGDFVQTVLHELMHLASVRMNRTRGNTVSPIYTSPMFRADPWTISVVPPTTGNSPRPLSVDTRHSSVSPMIRELIEWNLAPGTKEHKRDPLRKLLDYPLNGLYHTAYSMGDYVAILSLGMDKNAAVRHVMGMVDPSSAFGETFEQSIARIKAEIFAQLGSLYYYAPEYLMDNLPLAYNLFMEIDRNGRDATGPDDWFVRLSASLQAPGSEGRRADLVRRNVIGPYQQSLDLEQAGPRMGKVQAHPLGRTKI